MPPLQETTDKIAPAGSAKKTPVVREKQDATWQQSDEKVTVVDGESTQAQRSLITQENGYEKEQRLVVTITGKDRPGIVAEVMNGVAKCGVELVDLQQTAVRGRLSLALQLTLGTDPKEQVVFRELVLVGNRLDVRVEFDLPPKSQGKGKAEKCGPPTVLYALTLLSASSMSPSFLEELSRVLEKKGCEVQKVTRLSQKLLRSLELVLSKHEDMSSDDVTGFRKALYNFGKKHNIDIALQEESFMRRSKRLVVMDMDSTLIQQEVIDELARHAGKYEAVKAITHRAMGGGMDFKESLRLRVGLLKGTPASVFDKVISNLKYTPGAHHLCRSLKKLGYHLAVISGGFTNVTEHVRRELKLDYDYANRLEVGSDGCFTGRTVGPIVSAQRKADLLITIAQQERIALDQVIAIGKFAVT